MVVRILEGPNPYTLKSRQAISSHRVLLCTALDLMFRCKSLLALVLVYEPLCMSAVIEVTAGGAHATEPTYQFSDSSGSSVATLTANVTDGKIIASGVVEAADVRTSGGVSMDDLATRLAAAEASLASQEAIIASLKASATTQQTQIQNLLLHSGLVGSLLTFPYAHSNLITGAGSVSRVSQPYGGSARSIIGYQSGQEVTIIMASCVETMVGFVTGSFDPDNNPTHHDFPYAIACASGARQVYENGNYIMSTSDGLTGIMSFKLKIGGTVQYYENGAVIYTRLVTNTQWPLYVGARLQSDAPAYITGVQAIVQIPACPPPGRVAM